MVFRGRIVALLLLVAACGASAAPKENVVGRLFERPSAGAALEGTQRRRVAELARIIGNAEQARAAAPKETIARAEKIFGSERILEFTQLRRAHIGIPPETRVQRPEFVNLIPKTEKEYVAAYSSTFTESVQARLKKFHADFGKAPYAGPSARTDVEITGYLNSTAADLAIFVAHSEGGTTIRLPSGSKMEVVTLKELCAQYGKACLVITCYGADFDFTSPIELGKAIAQMMAVHRKLESTKNPTVADLQSARPESKAAGAARKAAEAAHKTAKAATDGAAKAADAAADAVGKAANAAAYAVEAGLAAATATVEEIAAVLAQTISKQKPEDMIVHMALRAPATRAIETAPSEEAHLVSAYKQHNLRREEAKSTFAIDKNGCRQLLGAGGMRVGAPDCSVPPAAENAPSSLR